MSAVLTIVLIDLSSVAYPIWHMSQDEPNVNHASQQIVARVRALAAGQPHVAVCIDSGRSFRAEIDPQYKGNRPERDERLHHQIKLAIEALRADGFPLWGAKGYEADDIIATAVACATRAGHHVVIVSGDKDLLQLVGSTVVAQSVKDGSRIDEAAVVTRFGVTPAQMRDYLTLVGDASDNVPGAKGIGPKGAVKLLATFGSLDDLYERIEEQGSRSLGLTPAITASLEEFRAQWKVTRSLITLRTDASIAFDEVLAERAAKPSTHTYANHDYDDEGENDMPTDVASAEALPETAAVPVTTIEPTTMMAKREAEVLPPAPAEWERQLDPRSIGQAKKLSLDMHQSAMFSGYGSPEAILATVLVGRELGIPAMTSLRTIHNIKGRHALSAQLIVALVLRSGMAEYFEPTELTDTRCTYVTKRKGGRGELSVTHTLEMARVAGLVKDDSGWVKNPQDMLAARASVRLARLVYPDICANVYTPDELKESA